MIIVTSALTMKNMKDVKETAAAARVADADEGLGAASGGNVIGGSGRTKDTPQG